MSSFLVALKRLREDRAPAVGLGVLVFATALIFGAAPRLLDRIGDEALHGVVARADAIGRNIAIVDDAPIPAGTPDDPLVYVDQAGDRDEAMLPESVRDLIGGRSAVIDSVRLHIEAPTTDPAFVRLRVQPGAETRIHYTAGRPPTATTRSVALPPEANPQPDEQGSAQKTATVIEVALSTDAVRQLGHGLGETVFLTPDPRDPLTIGVRAAWAAMDVVGVFDVEAPLDPFWYDDRGLELASIRSLGGDARAIDTVALLAPAAYGPELSLLPRQESFGAQDLPFRMTWRLFVDTKHLTVAGLDPLMADLRHVETTFGQVTGRRLTDAAIRSGLLPLLQAHAARWTSAVAVLTVVAIGPAAAAIAALGLIATIAARRRRPALALVRGRGATLGQIIRAVCLEGFVIIVPAFGLAVVATIVLIPAGSDRTTILAATIVAAGTLALLIATAVPGAMAVIHGDRDGDPPRGPGPRRLVLDAVVIVLAAAGAYLLRERGVRGSSSTGQLAGADPLIAAVPALAAIAAGLALIRLMPLPLRLLGRVAGAGRGIVPVLALRRAVQGGTTSAVLLVLLAAAAIGAFSSAALVHLDRAAEAGSWHDVGAPYRINDPFGALPVSLDPTALPGVRSIVNASATEVRIGIRGLRIPFISIDAAAYEAMVRGTAGDPRLPAPMLAPAAGAVVPVLISSTVAARADGVKVGDQFDVVVNGLQYRAQAIAATDSFPTLPSDALFAIASRQQLRAVHPEAQLIPTTIFLDAPESAGPAIRTAVAAIDPGAVVDGRAEKDRDFRDSPVTAAIVVGIVAAGLIATLYAALAVTAALALAGAARAVEVAHLRMLGLSRREALGLAIVEHGPTVLLAFIAGVGLGLGLFVLLEPGLGLDALVGSRVEIPLSADPRQLSIILATVLVIAAVGIGLAAWLQRRASPAAALRRGFE